MEVKMKKITIILTFLFLITFANAGTLFVGLEGSAPPTFSSDLSGFPNVTWTPHYSFDVSGATATPEGTLYLCEGAFTTHLYEASLTSSPQLICTISEDMSSLAYGRDTLWGFSNYADPKGIYSIDTITGTTTLELDVYTGYGFRFFALDYNPVDDLFYGYTEYGASGLYSINIDTGEMIQLTGSIPASNGQGRGMAVGNNTVYLTATRGDDGIPYFAYDIAQGVGGDWVEFPNPYPAYHSTGGAAFIPDPITTIELSGHVVGSDQPEVGLENCDVTLTGNESYQMFTDANGDFFFPEVEQNDDYILEITLEGYDIHTEDVSVGIENIDLGTITLIETALPATNVVAVINEENTEVSLTWDAPAVRELEFYDVFRFLEVNNQNPDDWDLLSSVIDETVYIDTGWEQLEPEMYQYAIIAQYTNGIAAEAAFSNVVEKLAVGTDMELPVVQTKVHNYPNPFNPTTTISFNLTAEDSKDAEIIIYNLKSQKIKTLYTFPSGSCRIGTREVIWNGTDSNDQPVSSGLYFYKLNVNGKTEAVKKCLLLK